MTRIAIIAAMEDELKPLVQGWRRKSGNDVDLWLRRRGETEWVAACGGIGAEAAKRAFAQVEADGPLDAVASVGWAGALHAEFKAGRSYLVCGVIDGVTGERFRASGDSGECWVVTSPGIAGREEKRRLAAAHDAALVDMEAAAVARLAMMRGIPFYCVKGVSDGFSERIPDFGRFVGPDGRLRRIRLVIFALFRPWHWAALGRLAKNSSRAAEAMKESLQALLDEK